MQACSKHATPDPDGCFGCKMAYWRAERSPFALPADRETWRNTTIREQAKDIVDRARSNGYDPQPVGTRWV